MVMPMKDLSTDVVRLQHEMNKLFDNWIGWPGSYREPLSDIAISDKMMTIAAELPGIEKEDVKVNIDEKGIEIKAERKEEIEESTDERYSYERAYNGFYRYIALPEHTNAKEAKAEYKNGILTVHVPLIKGNKQEVKVT